jgi:uncharacterized membrane protein YraQ (UPF0718 family)
MTFKEKIKRIPKSWYFLISIVFIYLLFSLFNKEVYLDSLNFFNDIILKIIPIFILVFVLMSVSNYFITPDFVTKHLKEKGIKKWFFVIIGGILSEGPIYIWYPLLADLRNKGLNYGLIACFLYNRAIKIPLIPLAIVYFSWQYVVILLVVMVFVSVLQGVLLNKLMGVKK